MARKDYRTAVLNYLNQHPNEDISREKLMAETAISKSRLSEVLNSIKNDGYTIVTPPRSGKVRLEISSGEEVLPAIKDQDIRQWIVILILSKYKKLTFTELLMKNLCLRDSGFEEMKVLVDTIGDKGAYSDADLIKVLRYAAGLSAADKEADIAGKLISVTALRRDLNELREKNIVRIKKQNRTRIKRQSHTYYELTGLAPHIIPISGDSLYAFCQRYEDFATTTTDLKPLKTAYKKIQTLIDMDGDDLIQHHYGKSNNISQKQMDTFEAFIAHPYKTQVLQLDTKHKEEIKSEKFAVGLLFYSIETGCFYAFGKNLAINKLQTRRLDWITSITTLEETHMEFHQKKYFEYFSEMFSSSYTGTSYHVKVLFQDFGNVRKRFLDLQEMRDKATIRAISNPPDGCIYNYAYEDTIRGLYDFARYLRGFGTSVLAVEPPELTEQMQFTYNRIIEKYEAEANE